MKTKKKKYLPLYEEWMKTGSLPDMYAGLCGFFDGDINFGLLKPTDKELSQHYEDGFDVCVWGETKYQLAHDRLGKFNDFRQTIVLFMAAMNDEL